MNTVQQFKDKAEVLKTGKLPAQVEIDELGNTIPAKQYRAEKLFLLAEEIVLIAWSPAAHPTAMEIASDARHWARRFSR